jgi:hypothetical protein
MHDEQVADNGEGQIAVEEPKSVDQLGKSIAKFSSRHSYARSTLRKRIWFDWLVRSAPELYEPLKSFRDHVPRLSRSFA